MNVYQLLVILGNFMLCWSLPYGRYFDDTEYPSYKRSYVQDTFFADPIYIVKDSYHNLDYPSYSKRSGVVKRYRSLNDLLEKLRSLAGNDVYHTGKAAHLRFGPGGKR